MSRLWPVLVLAGTTWTAPFPPAPPGPVTLSDLRTRSVSPSPSDAASSSGSRTIPYHARDLIALRAKVRYTTMIVLPDGEDIVEATCGDKEFWIVNARGAVAYVKPAKVASATNLNLVSATGQVYAFRLREISMTKGVEPDLAVYLEPDGLNDVGRRHGPKYVPAEQVEDFRVQVELAKEDARRAAQTAAATLDRELTYFRISYPFTLKFPYRFKPDVKPFRVQVMFHDDHVTYIQAQPRELPALYEWKDGAPNLVSFEVHGSTYVVPKILDSGYFAIGKARFAFTSDEAR
jgi:type IV secretion system protein VirB9